MAFAYLFACLALLAVSTAQDQSPELENKFVESPLCRTWSPLGTTYQPLELFPFKLTCRPSEDRQSVIMSMSTPADSGRAIVHAMVAAVTADGTTFIQGQGEYDTPEGYRTLTCIDKKVKAVKVDSTKVLESVVTFKLPEDKSVTVEDVNCRFFVAENLQTYWQSIFVPAVVPEVEGEGSGEEPTVDGEQTATEEGSGEEIIETEGSGQEEIVAPDTVNPRVNVAPVNTREPVNVAPVDTGAPVDVAPVDVAPVDTGAPVDVAPVNTRKPVDVAPVNTKEPVDVAPVDPVVVVDPAVDGETTNKATQQPTATVDVPPQPTTENNDEEESTETDVVILEPPKSADGLDVVVEKTKKVSMEGVKTGYWCGASGNVYVLKPNTDCRMFSQGIMKETRKDLFMRGTFACAPGTQFNTNVCQCVRTETFVCPDPDPTFVTPGAKANKTDAKEEVNEETVNDI